MEGKGLKSLRLQKTGLKATGRRAFLLRWLTIGVGVVFVAGLLFRLAEFFRSGSLPDSGRWTVGLGGEVTGVMILSSREKEMVWLELGPEVLVTAPGRGEYRLKALSKLGELSGEPFLVARSLGQNLAWPVNGWIKETDLGAGRALGEIKKVLESEFWQVFWGKRKTELSNWDGLRLWWVIKRTAVKEMRMVDLAAAGCFKPGELADGSRVEQIDQDCMDDLLGRIAGAREISEEALAVGVANASGCAGLAREGARMVANLGGTVVKLADWPAKSLGSEVRAGESMTAQMIAAAFEAPVTEGEKGDFLVDVLVILGEDYARRYGCF